MPWSASWVPQPSWPDPATRSSWLPDAPPWTCSPTTPSAATRSQTPYDAGSDAALRRGRDEHRDSSRAGSGVEPREGRSTPTSGARLVRPRERRAGAAADGVLPAARRLRAAAHHRPDHGPERVERVLLRA